MYRQSFIAGCVAVLMGIAVVSQSQTLSSLVQPGLMPEQVQSHIIEQAMPKMDIKIPAQQDALQKMQQRMQTRLSRDAQDYEAQLLKGLIDFQLGQIQDAVKEISDLSDRAPQFHLAHLIRADMLASRVRTITDIGEAGLFNESTQAAEQLDALRQEAQLRIEANLNPENDGKLPLQLLTLAPNVKTALLVDKARHRLYLFERDQQNAMPVLLRDFYVSTGRAEGNKKTEGDLRTPEGVYFITSWIPDQELPEKYGIGAFPTNYPNALDRRLGKTGDGIWLHGTDRIYYSRPPLDSEGCVVLSNLDLAKISHQIAPGQTPMIITDKVDWVARDEWDKVRSEVMNSVESWRADWESLDVNKYLRHYAQGFWSGNHNLTSWREHKSRVAKQKTFQKVALTDVSAFYYPRQASSGASMVVVSFKQQYQSNNYRSETSKKLYLGKQDGAWQILYEGS